MRYTHFVYISLFILAVLFSNFAFAQTLQVTTASAKLKDVDNNGYANIKDSISFQVYADGLVGPGGIGDSILVGVVFTRYGVLDTVYLVKSGGTSGGGYGNNVLSSLVNNTISAKTASTGFNAARVDTATSPATGSLRFILFKKLIAPLAVGSGPKQILQTKELYGTVSEMRCERPTRIL